MEASKYTRLCEANANANGEGGDEQRQPKTFFRRLNNVTKGKETEREGCR
jgi:hypothetical protein